MNSSHDIANLLSRIRIVLHRTSHPGNIGSAARAMKSMGLSRLALVAPARLPDSEAYALSCSAVDVLDDAQVCATLDEALAGTVLAVAFSARARDLSHTLLDARTAAVEAVNVARSGDVALVFGNEAAGLPNQEVMQCNRLARIPADLQYPSLNLAAAVQVVAYEIRMATAKPFVSTVKQAELATSEDLERLHEHLERSLRATGFLDAGKPKRLIERLRRLCARARLEREEVNFLRGMLNAWDRKGVTDNKS
jgi:tRNA/rRNA methyltransferase